MLLKSLFHIFVYRSIYVDLSRHRSFYVDFDVQSHRFDLFVLPIIFIISNRLVVSGRRRRVTAPSYKRYIKTEIGCHPYKKGLGYFYVGRRNNEAR